MKLSRKGILIIIFLLIVGLVFVYYLRGSGKIAKPKYTKYTGEEEAYMGRLSGIAMAFYTYEMSEGHYPIVVINRESGQDIIGTEMLKILFKEELLGPKSEQIAKIGLEKAFEQWGYSSYRSWNLTEEQWQKTKRVRLQNSKKNRRDFPLAWNTKVYKSKICYVPLEGVGARWLPEKEFNEYLKSAREWIEKE